MGHSAVAVMYSNETEHRQSNNRNSATLTRVQCCLLNNTTTNVLVSFEVITHEREKLHQVRLCKAFHFKVTIVRGDKGKVLDKCPQGP